MKQNLWAYFAGLLFGVGLVVAGMTQPAKVIGFLDFFGDWDASLMFVMAGAIAVHFVLFRLITRRRSPLFDARFHIPTRSDLDPRLITGAAIFGTGWGLGGFCPGPVLASLATGALAPAAFLVAMTAGMLVQHRTASLRLRGGGHGGQRADQAKPPARTTQPALQGG